MVRRRAPKVVWGIDDCSTWLVRKGGTKNQMQLPPRSRGCNDRDGDYSKVENESY